MLSSKQIRRINQQSPQTWLLFAQLHTNASCLLCFCYFAAETIWCKLGKDFIDWQIIKFNFQKVDRQTVFFMIQSNLEVEAFILVAWKSRYP